jgi:hypothetical protein
MSPQAVNHISTIVNKANGKLSIQVRTREQAEDMQRFTLAAAVALGLLGSVAGAQVREVSIGLNLEG